MIYMEDETIKVNGVVLPGLVKNIEVVEAAKIDEQEVEGSAARPKQATGYEDAKITVELILDDTETQTKYQRLEVLRSVFRKPGQSVPQPIPIICQDAAVHGIDRVLFKSLTHKVKNGKEQISVNLEFLEYIPQTITAVKSRTTTTTTGVETTNATNNLTEEYQTYLNDGLRGKSPAVDRLAKNDVIPMLQEILD